MSSENNSDLDEKFERMFFRGYATNKNSNHFMKTITILVTKIASVIFILASSLFGVALNAVYTALGFYIITYIIELFIKIKPGIKLNLLIFILAYPVLSGLFSTLLLCIGILFTPSD